MTLKRNREIDNNWKVANIGKLDEGQRRQSGLKSGGSRILVNHFDLKILIFSGNFTNEKSIFQSKFRKNFDILQVFYRQISEEFPFLGNFTKNFDFLETFMKIV